MSRVRVVLTKMPHLLREIVRSILATQADVELDPDPLPSRMLASAAALKHADVLILAEDGTPSDDYAPTLYAHPRLRLIAISDERRQAVLYELRPHRSPLGELSAELLVRAVRGATTTGGQS